MDKVRLVASLRESEERFRVALERTGVFAFSQDTNLCYTWVHNPAPELNGIAMIGKTDQDFLSPLDAEPIMALKRQVIETGKKAREEVQLTLNGNKYYYDMVVEPAFNSGGQIIGLLGSLLSITERKRAEEAIKEYALKLEHSNRDLEDFAFIASHDLQEPLRKVRAFGERLQSQYAHEIQPEARDYLERMINASERMRVMVEELLAYSRVSTKAQPFTEVDLEALALEVLSDLETRIEITQGKVEISNLPRVKADRQQMRHLLLNLVGNALKFHRPNQPPRVRLSGQMVNSTTAEIYIEDNGIGFDVQYLDRIFQPFQRLHGRSQFDGSGMGLAICRKIVERHGGAITAESEPGQGSRFILTLPLWPNGNRAR
jgi:PAS domain S-box-containing protein